MSAARAASNNKSRFSEVKSPSPPLSLCELASLTSTRRTSWRCRSWPHSSSAARCGRRRRCCGWLPCAPSPACRRPRSAAAARAPLRPRLPCCPYPWRWRAAGRECQQGRQCRRAAGLGGGLRGRAQNIRDVVELRHGAPVTDTRNRSQGGRTALSALLPAWLAHTSPSFLASLAEPGISLRMREEACEASSAGSQ
jgi:hypothetical protein